MKPIHLLFLLSILLLPKNAQAEELPTLPLDWLCMNSNAIWVGKPIAVKKISPTDYCPDTLYDIRFEILEIIRLSSIKEQIGDTLTLELRDYSFSEAPSTWNRWLIFAKAAPNPKKPNQPSTYINMSGFHVMGHDGLVYWPFQGPSSFDPYSFSIASTTTWAQHIEQTYFWLRFAKRFRVAFDDKKYEHLRLMAVRDMYNMIWTCPWMSRKQKQATINSFIDINYYSGDAYYFYSLGRTGRANLLARYSPHSLYLYRKVTTSDFWNKMTRRRR
jgi:hypothetical protein